MMDVIGWAVSNWENVFVAVNAALAAGIAIALLVPGEQPEGFLQKVLDVLKQFSRK